MSHYPFSLPSLPYSYDALSPAIDAQTLGYHHDKHMATYVENLNRALEPYPEYHSWRLERLCLEWAQLPDNIRTAVRNNAGGVYNHSIYFQAMAPVGTTTPNETLRTAIERDFGSMQGFKNALTASAMSVFGSGWAWLVSDLNGNLSIYTLPNQETPLPLLPLACVDVWEHAYYLQYKNRRIEYVDNFMPLLNWDFIAQQYDSLRRGAPPYPLG